MDVDEAIELTVHIERLEAIVGYLATALLLMPGGGFRQFYPDVAQILDALDRDELGEAYRLIVLRGLTKKHDAPASGSPAS